MADHDPPGLGSPPPDEAGMRCPWCSARVESLEEATCGACGATLHGDPDVEVPGVTAIDGEHALQAAAPRKVRRTFGSLFVGRDDQIPPPSQAELPALAPPDGEVRREMLRLQLDAELADLAARAAVIAAERGVPLPGLPSAEPAPEAEGDLAAGPAAATPTAPAAAALESPALESPAAEPGSGAPRPPALAASLGTGSRPKRPRRRSARP